MFDILKGPYKTAQNAAAAAPTLALFYYGTIFYCPWVEDPGAVEKEPFLLRCRNLPVQLPVQS